MDRRIGRKKGTVVPFPAAERQKEEEPRGKPPAEETGAANSAQEDREKEHVQLAQLNKIVSDAYVLLAYGERILRSMRRTAAAKELSIAAALQKDIDTVRDWLYRADMALKTIDTQDELTRMRRILERIKEYPRRAADRLRKFISKEEGGQPADVGKEE